MTIRPVSVAVMVGLLSALLRAGAAELAADKIQLKPACHGLMTSGWGQLSSEKLAFLDSVAVNLEWRQLETKEQAFDGPAWDKIEAARQRGFRIRVRVLCGIYSPDFIKGLGGVELSDAEHGLDASRSGGVAIWNAFSKRGGLAPCFWKKEYLDQYEQLMTEMARRYENAPEVCEVIDSACMTVFAEPFYRAHGDRNSNTRLWQAGLNFQSDLAAHQRALQIHQKLFRKTRTSLAVNTWDIIDDSPTHYHKSWEETRKLADWARQLLGERLVLQNNGFWVDSGRALEESPETSHIAYIRSAPGSRGFQSRLNPQSEAQFFELVELASKAGINFMEFGSYEKYDVARLRQMDAALKANPKK